mgnify:CR=1 FL=1|tara:strand:+ start:32 stop:478 length:447 start_codon:yes stop_codon:yes gene_type:complete
MPNFKKTSGFKMSGYSYPGKSPMKGKRKDADLAAAAEGQATATAKMEEFGEMKMKSTDILGKGSFKVDTGSSPIAKRSPAKNWLGTMVESIGKAATSETGKAIGKSATDAIVGGAVSAGINAIGRKKEKPKRKAADQSGFAGIKMGTK